MILLFRSNGIFASRVNKYVDYYNKNGLSYRIIGWDRLGEGLSRFNYDFFHLKTRYVQGGFKAFIAKIKWMRFVYSYLKRYEKEITTIHACDLDVALPSAFFKLLHNHKVNLIFDVCDWSSASVANWLLKLFYMVSERFAVKFSNHMILCEPERVQQIQFQLKIPVHIMRNIPSFDNVSFLDEETVPPFNNDNITVAYVGWFGHGRFLEELLDYSKCGHINLNIAGFGLSSIEEYANRLDNSLDNVRFWGKVDYRFGLQIMKASDLIYAMYCKSIPNHFYAAPNKFYESIFLGKPILSTKGIPLADKINNYETGFTIEENQIELSSFFDNISKKELYESGKKAHLQWPYFSGLTEEFMNNEYSKMIV